MKTIAELSERDKTILDTLNEGKTSVAELGRRFNISRERVSQIYYRITGFPRGTLKRVKKFRDTTVIKFVCSGCQKPITVGEGKYLHKYCRDCHVISQTTNRIPKVTATCTACGKKYHPLSISARRNKIQIGTFCSFDCYVKHPVRIGRPKLDAQEVGA